MKKYDDLARMDKQADSTGAATAPANEKAAHTPGPWTFTGRSIIAGDYEFFLRGDAGWTLKDARLIAAAPELLAALKFWVQVFDLTATDSYCEACQWHAPKDDDGHIIGPINHQVGCPYLHARSTIAKAEGR